MSSLRSLQYWIATGFLLCTWEAPLRCLSMSFNDDKGDVHKLFGDEGDGHKLSGDESDKYKHCRDEGDGDGLKLFGDEGGGLKLFGDEGGGLKLFGDEGSGLKLFGDEGDGHMVFGDEGNRGYEFDPDEDCVPPSNSSAPVGLRGYRRYFANDSLIGRPVPCTRDDKICFRHNLVFDPTSDRCKALLETCGNTKAITVVIESGLEHGSGRVLGFCPKYNDPCPGYRMSYDGRCYRKKVVRDVICGCNATLSPHILGGMECREQPISPINVQQPEEDGSCAIPDLHNPDPRSSMLHDDFFRDEYKKELQCSSDQAACFSKGKVFVSGYEGCHSLLERGPCAEDHVVALDLQAASEGRAEGTCVHERGGCPKGYKRMLFDGQCHEDREIKIAAPGEIILDAFGRYFATQYTPVRFRPIINGNGSCVIDVKTTLDDQQSPIKPALPPCGPNNTGECKRYEVEDAPSMPDVNDGK